MGALLPVGTGEILGLHEVFQMLSFPLGLAHTSPAENQGSYFQLVERGSLSCLFSLCWVVKRQGQCFLCGTWLKQIVYGLKVFCFVRLPFEVESELFMFCVCFLSVFIGASRFLLSSHLSLEYMTQKENTGNSLLCHMLFFE